MVVNDECLFVKRILQKKMKKFPINCLAISGNSNHFLFFQKKNIKNRTPWGQGGSPNYLFYPKYYFFGTQKPAQNFGTLR